MKIKKCNTVPIKKKVVYKEYYKINDPAVKEYAKQYSLTIKEAHKGLNEYASCYYGS